MSKTKGILMVNKIKGESKHYTELLWKSRKSKKKKELKSRPAGVYEVSVNQVQTYTFLNSQKSLSFNWKHVI